MSDTVGMSSSPGSDLSTSRYGRSDRPRWLRTTGIVLALVVATAWAMWAALGQSNQPVSYQLHSYDVVSESQITLKVEVHRDDPSKPATCSVYAQANDHSTVGEKTFDVPPSTDKTVFADTTLQTERRAVTGLVRRCELAN